MRQGDITYRRVPRVGGYWFGHRRYDDGTGTQPTGIERPYYLGPSELTDRPVCGVSIAAESEVRAVRIALWGEGDSVPTPAGYSGPWVELVEGEPVALVALERARIALDRLDWTDGELVLALAHTDEAVAALPRTRCASRVTFSHCALAVNEQLRVHLRGEAQGRVAWAIQNHDGAAALAGRVGGVIVPAGGGLLLDAGGQDVTPAAGEVDAGHVDFVGRTVVGFNQSTALEISGVLTGGRLA